MVNDSTPTEDETGARQDSGNERLGLCYVESPWAWFTSMPVEEQWGDDWDDAPYQHNAGKPYPEEGVTHEKVAFDGPLYAPAEGPRKEHDGIEHVGIHGNFVAVEDMNRGENRVPWLVETDYGPMYGEAGVEIYAGTSLEEFIGFVQEAGGSVYRAVGADSDRSGGSR